MTGQVGDERAQKTGPMMPGEDPLTRPIPMGWDEIERPCRTCKLPTHWRTRRGAAIHPMCEAGPFEAMTAQAEREVLMSFVDVFPDLTIVKAPPPAPAGQDRVLEPIPVRAGPCSWCGQPGFGIQGTGGADRDGTRPWQTDRYFHCRDHLFHPYVWPEEAP